MLEEFGTMKKVKEIYTTDEILDVSELKRSYSVFEQIIFNMFKNDIERKYCQIPENIFISSDFYPHKEGDISIDWEVSGYIRRESND